MSPSPRSRCELCPAPMAPASAPGAGGLMFTVLFQKADFMPRELVLELSSRLAT